MKIEFLVTGSISIILGLFTLSKQLYKSSWNPQVKQ